MNNFIFLICSFLKINKIYFISKNINLQLNLNNLNWTKISNNLPLNYNLTKKFENYIISSLIPNDNNILFEWCYKQGYYNIFDCYKVNDLLIKKIIIANEQILARSNYIFHNNEAEGCIERLFRTQMISEKLLKEINSEQKLVYSWWCILHHKHKYFEEEWFYNFVDECIENISDYIYLFLCKLNKKSIEKINKTRNYKKDNKIISQIIPQRKKLSFDFIKYLDKNNLLVWEIIKDYSNFDDEIIIYFQDKVNWKIIFQNNRSNFLMKYYIKNIKENDTSFWEMISCNELSEDFIFEFGHNFTNYCWYRIFKYNQISPIFFKKIIKQFKFKVNWEIICSNKSLLTNEFIEEYYTNFNDKCWENILLTKYDENYQKNEEFIIKWNLHTRFTSYLLSKLKFSEKFINEIIKINNEKIDWNLIIENQKLSEEFFEKNMDKIKCINVSIYGSKNGLELAYKNHQFSLNFIEKYYSICSKLGKIFKYQNISKNQKTCEYLINKYYKKNYYSNYISKYCNLSPNFIKKNINKLNKSELLVNKFITEEIIQFIIKY